MYASARQCGYGLSEVDFNFSAQTRARNNFSAHIFPAISVMRTSLRIHIDIWYTAMHSIYIYIYVQSGAGM